MSERKVKIMDVAPEVAVRWLEKNVRNRDIRQSVVDAYTEAMKKDKWILTAEPIAFSRPFTDNMGNQLPETLINGQHRLWAVVQANKPVKFTVWWGCEPEEFGVIDQGPGRTQGDVLQITRRDVHDPTKVATIINSVRKMLFAKHDRMMTWETELLLAKYPREIELVVGYKKALGKLADRSVQAALFIGTLIDEAKTAGLVQRLHSAVGFTERDPVRALHIYLHGQLAATTRTMDTHESAFYKILHCVLCEIDGRSLVRPQPIIDHLGDARRRLKGQIDSVVRELHLGRLPSNFYQPRNTLRPASKEAA